MTKLIVKGVRRLWGKLSVDFGYPKGLYTWAYSDRTRGSCVKVKYLDEILGINSLFRGC